MDRLMIDELKAFIAERFFYGCAPGYISRLIDGFFERYEAERPLNGD